MSQADPADRLTIGVVVAKRRLVGPWADHAWLPTGILPAPPDVAPWTLLSSDERQDNFYAGPFELTLYRGDTSHYRDNLHSGRPSLWVSLRATEPDRHEIATVTADPYEVESMAEGIGEIVEAVDMPESVQRDLAAFVAAFHVERPFVKRKRDRPDREALARGQRGGQRQDGTS